MPSSRLSSGEISLNVNILHAWRSALHSGVAPVRMGLTPEEAETIDSLSHQDMEMLAQSTLLPLAIASDAVDALGHVNTSEGVFHSEKVTISEAVRNCQRVLRRRRFR